MLAATDRPHALAAIRIDLGAIFVSMELSQSTWLITTSSSVAPSPTKRCAEFQTDMAQPSTTTGRSCLNSLSFQARPHAFGILANCERIIPPLSAQ
jgi:hypothetical protein